MGRIGYATIIVLVLITLGIEIKGGMESGSLGLISDAGHLGAGDLVPLILGWSAFEVRKHFGQALWLEWLTTASNILLLLTVGTTILVASAFRMVAPADITHAMLPYAVMGCIGNALQAIATRVLEGEHECTHVHVGQKLHFIFDFGCSVAVVAVAVVLGATGWVWLDAAVAALIAGISLIMAYVLFRHLREPPDDGHRIAHLYREHGQRHHHTHHEPDAHLFWTTHPH